MATTYDLILKGATLVNHDGVVAVEVGCGLRESVAQFDLVGGS